MEILKNFATGLVVIILALITIGISMLLWPLLLIAGSLFLISIKLILFIALFLGLIILVGHLVRKSFKKVG